jgi:hypothetical protein
VGPRLGSESSKRAFSFIEGLENHTDLKPLLAVLIGK